MRFHLALRRFSSPLGLSVLVLATLSLVVIAITVVRAQRQARLVANVARTGGAVEYSFLVAASEWWIDRLGRDLLGEPTSVVYFEMGAFPPYDPVNYQNYSALCSLPRLEKIDILDSAFPIDVLKHMRGLRHLAIVQNGLDDSDMQIIAKLHQLRTLSLAFNELSDAGAKQLSSLTNLSDLDLSGNYVSNEAIAELQRALPNCRIKNSSSRVKSLPYTAASD